MCRTRIPVGARIAAMLIDAGQCHRTFAIRAAFGLLIGRHIGDNVAETIPERIADEAGGTDAGGTAILCGAGGRWGAWICVYARIDDGWRSGCTETERSVVLANEIQVRQMGKDSLGFLRVRRYVGVTS